MNINATLFGQMLTFLVFVVFTMKYVWPPMMQALSERQKKIADGIAAAEEGHKSLEQAKVNADSQIQEAKQQALSIIDEANKQASQILEEAKGHAKKEAERLIANAEEEISQSYNQAKQQLRDQIVTIALTGAEKILEQSIDQGAHEKLLDKLVTDIR